VDSSQTVLDLDNPESYCPCCQMPYPEDGDMYGLCDSNDKLGDMGEGFPLFFIFVKYLTVLLLVLTIVYFVPVAYLMYQAYQKVKGKMTGLDDKLGLFSFGVFVKFSDPRQPEAYAVFEDRQQYVEAVTALVMVAIVVTLLMNIYLRKRLLDKALKLDRQAYTPSDFCLMGWCPSFSESCDYTTRSIQEEIKSFLEQEENGVDGSEIEYIVVAYDIHDIYQITAEYQQHLKHRELVRGYSEGKGWTEEELQAKDPDAEEDWPTVDGREGIWARVPCASWCCGRQKLAPAEIEADIKRCQERLEELTHQKVLDGEENEEDQQ